MYRKTKHCGGRKRRYIKDIVCSGDDRLFVKEEHKWENNYRLKVKLYKLSSMKSLRVISIIVGALRTIITELPKLLCKIGINVKVLNLQTITVIGTARIHRRALES